MNLQQAMTVLDQAALFPKKAGLEHMEALLGALDHPERSLRFVHIAGTNGKGSTAAFLSHALAGQGYRTGQFTSPYIHRFHERIQVNGSPIGDGDLCRILERVCAAAGRLCSPATFFELVTALGLCYFLEQRCDIVVLEVGLGGRLDCTNAIPCPDVAVIAHIGLDHTAILGDTLEQIAAEKAGIIKPGGDVVLLAQTPGVQKVVQHACTAANAKLHIAQAPPFRMEGERAVLLLPWGELPLGLPGCFQVQNAALALKTLTILANKGFPVGEEALREGFSKLCWPGRFELLQRSPFFLLDGAHNPQGVTALLESLQAVFPRQTQQQRCIFLAGLMADKDHLNCLALAAPYASAMVAIASPEPRALPPEALAREMGRFCSRVYTAASPEQGVALALSLAEPEDLVCAFGSLHLCGPIRDAVLRQS